MERGNIIEILGERKEQHGDKCPMPCVRDNQSGTVY